MPTLKRTPWKVIEKRMCKLLQISMKLWIKASCSFKPLIQSNKKEIIMIGHLSRNIQLITSLLLAGKLVRHILLILKIIIGSLIHKRIEKSVI